MTFGSGSSSSARCSVHHDRYDVFLLGDLTYISSRYFILILSCPQAAGFVSILAHKHVFFSFTSFCHHKLRSHTFLTSIPLPMIPFVITLAFSPLLN
jgi:hypothetical protein